MNYQKLFSHLSQEHGLILLQTEMHEIVIIVNEMQNEALSQPLVVGRSEQRDLLLAMGRDVLENTHTGFQSSLEDIADSIIANNCG